MEPAPTTNGIRLVVGDDVYVAGDQTANTLTNLRRVATPASPSDVIHLQLAKNTVSTGTAYSLSVDNFFAKAFVFHALLEYASAPGQPMPSCTYPVEPAITDFEVWSDPLTAVTFQDVAFPATVNDGLCAYY